MSRLLALLPVFGLLTACGGWYVSHGNSGDRRSPLEKAAQLGDVTEVNRLLASGADPNDKGGVFGCPLNSAALRNNNVEVIRILLAAGANPNGRAAEARMCWVSPLWLAATTGDIDNTRALLDAGAAIYQSSCSKPVVGWMKTPVVDMLVQHGFNLNAVDEQGRNQLHIALAPPVVPPLEGIEYLVRSGIPVNARDSSGKTPLAYWREARDYEIHWFTTWLLERVSGDPFSHAQRETRAKISAFLDRSGASL